MPAGARATHLGALFVLLVGCDAGAGTPSAPPSAQPVSLVRDAPSALQGNVAGPASALPAVLVRDGAGRPVARVPVSFSVTAGAGWVTEHTVNTDANGRATTTWYLGPMPGPGHALAASTGELSTHFAATAQPLVAGTTYWGANQYIEMIPGELPIIISAPHGGSLQPAEIPDRTGDVTTVRDANTEELARDIAAEFRARTGRAPTLVIVRLHRSKLDANREIVEAAGGNAAAERAWREYHGFIEAARAAIVAAGRTGFYIDLHGHGHENQRVELGYLLSAADLAQPDAALNAPAMLQKSSIGAAVSSAGPTHAELLRGSASLGSLFEQRGFPAVPSASQPHPGNAPYFSGGYSTRRHSSQDGSLISGVQLEANRVGVRDTPANRQRFAAALVDVLHAWNPELVTASRAAPTPPPIRLQPRRSRAAR